MIVIEAPHFYCGVEVENGRVTIAAPIVGWMKGKTLIEVMDYCHRKGWRVTMPEPHDAGSSNQRH
jgi:hypothetical protein